MGSDLQLILFIVQSKAGRYGIGEIKAPFDRVPISTADIHTYFGCTLIDTSQYIRNTTTHIRRWLTAFMNH